MAVCSQIYPNIILILPFHRGQGSSVGIATGYRLDGPGIESRWWVRLSAPVQAGAGAHPAFYKMGTGYFPGVKSVRGVTLTPHPLLVSWSRKSRAITLLSLWAVRLVQNLSACTTVHFTFTFYFPIKSRVSSVVFRRVTKIVMSDY